MGFPGGSNGKECACHAGDLGSIPELERAPGEGNGHPLQNSLPGEFHGHRSPRGHKELDTTEQLTLSCTCTERQWINRKQNVDQAKLEKHLADT